MKKFIKIFKALSDQTRIKILYLLLSSGKELCVCEITDILEVPQYNISKHLKILENTGLLKSVKDKKWVYYSIANDIDPCVSKIFEFVSSIPSGYFKGQREELKKRLKLRKDGRCIIGVQKKQLL